MSLLKITAPEIFNFLRACCLLIRPENRRKPNSTFIPRAFPSYYIFPTRPTNFPAKSTIATKHLRVELQRGVSKYIELHCRLEMHASMFRMNTFVNLPVDAEISTTPNIRMIFIT